MATKVDRMEYVPFLADADSAKDRRGTSRFTILIRSAKLLDEDKEYLCVIRDVSEFGVKLRLYNEIPQGKTLGLELANGDRFAVRQVWSREGFGGFQFSGPVDLERLIETESGPYPQRKLRLRTRIEGSIGWGDQSCPASLDNISQQGAAIRSDAHFAIDQLVRLDCPNLPTIYAKIRWRNQPHYGLIFEHTLPFEALTALSGM